MSRCNSFRNLITPNVPWYDTPGKNEQENNEHKWFSGLSHHKSTGVVRVDTVKETLADYNKIFSSGGGQLTLVETLYLPTNDRSLNSPAKITKTSDGKEIGNASWGDYLRH